MKKIKLLISLTVGTLLLGVFTANKSTEIANAATPDEIISQCVYRMYNQNSGEHFYTLQEQERNVLVQKGWEYEGIGWYAPTSGTPVYRLYNPNTGDHHYTMSEGEKNNLVQVGWQYEGIGWYSSTKKEVPLYRAYNPNAKAGSHNYTINNAEQKNLIKVGWKDEGIGWYGTNKKTNTEEIMPPKPTDRWENITKETKVEEGQTYLIFKYFDSEAEANEYFNYYCKANNFEQGAGNSYEDTTNGKYYLKAFFWKK